MLTALLLAGWLAAAAPDWVEISQQHYRKPVRTHIHHKVEDGPVRPAYHISEDERRNEGNVRRAPNHPQDPLRLPTSYTIPDEVVRLANPKEDTRVYSNQSISEHTWNQNKYRVPGKADNFKQKHNVTPEFSLEIYETVTENVPELVTRSILDDQERVSATVERVPNKGSVQRVQLLNTPVKSPTVTNAVSPIKRNDIRKYGPTTADDSVSDEFAINSDNLKNTQGNIIAMSAAKDVNNVFSSTKETPVEHNNYDRIITSAGWTTSEPSAPFQKYPRIQHNKKPDTQMDTTNNWRDTIKNSHMKNILVDDKNRISEDVNDKSYENIKTNKDKIAGNIPNFVTINDKNIREPEDTNFEEVTVSEDSANENHRPHDVNSQYPKGKNKRPNSDSDANRGDDNRNEKVKVSTMENVMKFMKVVADTISKNTRRGVTGKVKYLNELKETLLGSIKDRIDATWPDDNTSATTRRHSRSATARGHVEFPSSESALMTISFLTFAVFLIKLVLQVIQTYKNKAVMMAPLVVATAGRSVRKLRNFH